MNLGFKGRFKVVKKQVLMDGDKPILDKNGYQIVVGEDIVAEFDNLITNTGLNRIGTGTVLSHCYLSSDNTEPSFTDNSVVGFLAAAPRGRIDDAGNSTVGNIYFSLSTTYSFAAGVGTGNISKLGIGWDASGSNLWSIQLVKDLNGDATVISKLPNEILEITYVLTTYISAVDYVGSVTISGVSHNVTVRPSVIGNWKNLEPHVLVSSMYQCRFCSGAIGSIENQPSGFMDNTLAVNGSYTNQSLEYKYLISADVSQGNSPTGIKSLYIAANNTNKIAYQAEFNPPIMKTDQQTLKLPPFIISWGRYVAP